MKNGIKQKKNCSLIGLKACILLLLKSIKMYSINMNFVHVFKTLLSPGYSTLTTTKTNVRHEFNVHKNTCRQRVNNNIQGKI